MKDLVRDFIKQKAKKTDMKRSQLLLSSLGNSQKRNRISYNRQGDPLRIVQVIEI